MHITDLKCAVIGDHPIVRIVTDEGLSGYADMAGVELLVIDEHTRAADFKNQLCWNQVYYHLAHGL